MMRISTTVLMAVAWVLSASAGAETEQRPLDGFDRVVFALPGDLILRRGDSYEVVVEGDADDLERIVTEVSGSVLTIGWNQRLLGMFGGGPEDDVVVRVTLPALKGLELAGSGDADAGSWMSESFELEVNGSGSVTFGELATEDLSIELAGSGDVSVAQLDAALVRVDLRGSGDVELAGAADDQKIEIMGSGDVDAAELEGARVDVEIMGSGDVSVWATDTLSAEIMGSGDVRYRGNPKVEREERGSGEVRPQ